MTRLALLVIRGYQRWFTRYTRECPEAISCSQYGYEAVRDHGFRKGVILAAERLENCGL